MYTNQTVHGDLIHYDNDSVGICPTGQDESAEVYPESVAQLVGYDSVGQELYDNDSIVDKLGNVYTVHQLLTMVSRKSLPIYTDIGDTLFGYRKYNDK